MCNTVCAVIVLQVSLGLLQHLFYCTLNQTCNKIKYMFSFFIVAFSLFYCRWNHIIKQKLHLYLWKQTSGNYWANYTAAASLLEIHVFDSRTQRHQMADYEGKKSPSIKYLFTSSFTIMRQM